MEGIDNLRKAQNTVNRDGAIHKYEEAIVQAAQKKGKDYASDLFALPCDPALWQPLQNLTIGDPNYGLFYELQGVDAQGNKAPRPNP